jgi:hypothetical protein
LIHLADLLAGVGAGVLLKLAVDIARSAWKIWREGRS